MADQRKGYVKKLTIKNERKAPFSLKDFIAYNYMGAFFIERGFFIACKYMGYTEKA